jgi:hypothetical protein
MSILSHPLFDLWHPLTYLKTCQRLGPDVHHRHGLRAILVAVEVAGWMPVLDVEFEKAGEGVGFHLALLAHVLDVVVEWSLYVVDWWWLLKVLLAEWMED